MLSWLKAIKEKLNVNTVLWLVYLALLGVLLPHTAWAFERFEPPGLQGRAVAWLAATFFEAAIAVLTHKLAKHIETVTRGKRKFWRRYGNAYAAGLVVCMAVSVAANLAHAVEFGQGLKIFGSSSSLPAVYSVAFGAILPIVSLLFARVLSNVVETEGEANQELDEAKATIKDIRAQLKEAKEQIGQAEARALQAEERFGAAGDLFARLFAQEKRVRIIAAAETWPVLPGTAIAKMTEASPAYVSEVLRGERLEEVVRGTDTDA